jgi:VanZ family protein
LSARSQLRRFASAPLPLWLAALAVVLTVIFGDLPGEGQYMAVLQNGCHSPAFAVLSLITLALLKPRAPSPLARAVLTVTALVLVGAATEGIQSLFGRDAELEDVANDLVGALGATSAWLYFEWRGRAGSAARIARIVVLAICASAVAWWLNPFVQCTRAYRERGAQFPVLAQFRSPRDLYFVTSRGTDTRLVPTDERPDRSGSGIALQTTLDSRPWPGFELFELMPDWRGHRLLKVDLSNPGATDLTLILRVNDRGHRGGADDRFNMGVLLPPRTRRVLSIPLVAMESSPRTRKMDLSEIDQLIVFRSGGGAPDQALRLHRVWLE